MDEDLGKV